MSGNTTILSDFRYMPSLTGMCVSRRGWLVYLTFGDAELDLNKNLSSSPLQRTRLPQITNETKILQQISKETDIQVERLKQLLNTKVADAEQDIKNTVVEITKKVRSMRQRRTKRHDKWPQRALPKSMCMTPRRTINWPQIPHQHHYCRH